MFKRDTLGACPGACRCSVAIYRRQPLPCAESPLTTCARQGEAIFRRCATGRIPRDLNVAIRISERGKCSVCCVSREEGSGGQRRYNPVFITPLQGNQYFSYVVVSNGSTSIDTQVAKGCNNNSNSSTLQVPVTPLNCA